MTIAIIIIAAAAAVAILALILYLRLRKSKGKAQQRFLYTYCKDLGGYDVMAFDSKASALDLPREYDGAPVARISEHAFRGCKELREVTLPASLRQIDVRAFGGAEMKAYYEGTREEGEKISFRGGKNGLSGLSLYFLSPEQPKDAGARQAKNVRETGLWHRGSRGERLIWEPAAKEQGETDAQNAQDTPGTQQNASGEEDAAQQP